MAGRRIVEVVREDLVLSKLPTREAFANAIRTLAAVGGSTNAVVHRLVDLMPSGRFLMEDFCYAGGLPALLRELGARPAAQGCRHRQRPYAVRGRARRAGLKPRGDHGP